MMLVFGQEKDLLLLGVAAERRSAVQQRDAMPASRSPFVRLATPRPVGT